MILIAIDPSYTNTGIAIYNTETEEYKFESFTSKTHQIGKSGRPLKNKFDNQTQKFLTEMIRIECYATFKQNVKVYYNEMFSHNINTTKRLYELVGIIKGVFKSENVHELNESKVIKNVLPHKTLPRDSKIKRRDFNKQRSVNYFKEQMGYYPENDDIADAFMIIQYVLKNKLHEENNE